jgi:type II secretory pathway component PulK
VTDYVVAYIARKAGIALTVVVVLAVITGGLYARWRYERSIRGVTNQLPACQHCQGCR